MNIRYELFTAKAWWLPYVVIGIGLVSALLILLIFS
jgi:hypothetical protein